MISKPASLLTVLFFVSCSSKGGGVNVDATRGPGDGASDAPGTHGTPGKRACPGTPLSLGVGGSLNGFVPFPATNAWNTDISAAPVDPSFAAASFPEFFNGDHLHHDFASADYGIPYIVVDSSITPSVPISVPMYGDQSDVSVAPYSSDTPVEGHPGPCVGGPNNYAGDQHAIVIDRNTCEIFETYNTAFCNGAWSADAETLWDMVDGEMRPWSWTSVDAAGLSVFAGLVRYDEVAAGEIKHAFRFTMLHTKNDSNGG